MLIVRVDPVTVMDRTRVALACCESATRAVNEMLVAPVGMPVIAPVDGFNVKPAGKDPWEIDHVYGVAPPDAASEVE